MKMAINKKDWEVWEKLVCNADNSQLYKMLEIVEKEIRLSEITIEEGFEKRR